MTILALGTTSLIAVQASMPLRRGIRTSISTMSGSSVDGQLDRLGAVAGLADDLDVGLLAEDHLQPTAEQRVVVDDEHADRLGAAGDREARRPRRLTCVLGHPRILLGRCVGRGAGPIARTTREHTRTLRAIPRG